MNKDILERIIFSHIKNLFPGVNIKRGPGPDKQRKYAVFSKGQTEIRIRGIDGESFFLSRPQPFTKQELKIINDIIHIADEYSDLPYDTQVYLIYVSLNRMVARSLVDDGLDSGSKFETFVSLVINILEKRAAETYEGTRISMSLGIDYSNDRPGDDFDSFVQEDFSKVLSNGYDTLIEFSKNGALLGHFGLNEFSDPKFAPYRYSSFESYTKNNKKYAFVLNRNGEILIFRNGKLFFAKRRGEWRLFSHDSVLTQLCFGSRKANQRLQNAIYLSALDVSFARCGGCIGVIYKSNMNRFYKDKIVKENDLLINQGNIKAKSLKKIISDKKFYELDRRVRQEILGIDGATIIDYEGNILAAGTILNITQKETTPAVGGARTAAARALSLYGYSLKISEDGEISAFGKSYRNFKFG